MKAKETKSVGKQTIFERAYACAVYGAMVWTVYAIVECWFSILLPWIIKPSYDYVPLHWGFTALLFVIYPLIGLMLGGLFGFGISIIAGRIWFLQKVESAIFFPVVAKFTVVLALAAYFVFLLSLDIYVPHLLPPLFISILLMLVLVLSASSSIWFRRLRFLANSWTTCILLLGLPWITKELLINNSRTDKTVAVLAYTVVILLIAFFVVRIMEKQQNGKKSEAVQISTTRSIVLLSIITSLFLGISFFFQQTPRSEASNLKSPPLGVGAYQPNVILIVMDTVRADHLSPYGYHRDTTPNLKKFAEEATLYTRSIASGSETLSTHASIFTGVYASQHGAHITQELPVGRPLSDKFYTMAEILSEKGYSTMGVVANFGYLSHVFHLDQGFQYFDNRVPVHFYSRTKPYYLRQLIRTIFARYASPYEFEVVYRRAEDINKEVYSLLGKVKITGKPFFLFVNYMDAHLPYIPPPSFDTLYPGKDDTFTTPRYTALNLKMGKLNHKVPEKDRIHLVSQYDGGIAYIDFHIGKLITRLRELGLYENSLIIITSDHGEAFGERNRLGHGSSVYQDQVNVPLIIKYPNYNKGHVIDELVNSVDLMPTILDVLGYERSEGIRGESLVKLKPGKPRSVISESFCFTQQPDLRQRFDRIERAILTGPYKLIISTRGEKELYNLSKDPHEKKNINQSEDIIFIELEARLNNWVEMTVTEFSSPANLDQDALDRLKTLGYVQ